MRPNAKLISSMSVVYRFRRVQPFSRRSAAGVRRAWPRPSSAPSLACSSTATSSRTKSASSTLVKSGHHAAGLVGQRQGIGHAPVQKPIDVRHKGIGHGDFALETLGENVALHGLDRRGRVASTQTPRPGSRAPDVGHDRSVGPRPRSGSAPRARAFAARDGTQAPGPCRGPRRLSSVRDDVAGFCHATSDVLPLALPSGLGRRLGRGMPRHCRGLGSPQRRRSPVGGFIRSSSAVIQPASTRAAMIISSASLRSSSKPSRTPL